MLRRWARRYFRFAISLASAIRGRIPWNAAFRIGAPARGVRAAGAIEIREKFMLEAKLEKSFTVRMVVVGLFTCGLGALMMYHESRSYVHMLDEEGVTLRNGKRFAWKDLQVVRPRYTGVTGRAMLSYIYLDFTNGTAGVFYQMFSNGVDVVDFVRRMTKQPLPLTA
jgi:hypothetical protein